MVAKELGFHDLKYAWKRRKGSSFGRVFEQNHFEIE